MQFFLLLLRMAASAVMLALVVIFVITLIKFAYPQVIPSDSFINPVLAYWAVDYVVQNLFVPIIEYLKTRGTTPSEILLNVFNDLISSILVTIFKLTALDVLNLILVGIIVPIFTLTFNRVRNHQMRRECSAHLYLIIAKFVDNRTALQKMAQEGKGKIAINPDSRARFHKLSSELQALSDFAIAYQYVFTRRARKTSIPARMRIAPAKEVVDLILSEIDRVGSGQIDLEDRRFWPVMVYRGRALVAIIYDFFVDLIRALRGFPQIDHPPPSLTRMPLFSALDIVLDLNVELAVRLEGRFLLVWPARGRSLPRRVRQMSGVSEVISIWRARRRRTDYQRFAKVEREGNWPLAPELPTILASPKLIAADRRTQLRRELAPAVEGSI